MSGPGSGSECSYTHDISSDEFNDLRGDTWHCPLQTIEEGNYCLFHLPATERETHSPEPSDIGDALVSVVNSTPSSPNRILGMRCPGIDLDYKVLNGETNQPIDLRDSFVDGELTAKEANIHQRLIFDHSEFCGEVSFHDAQFHREASFSGVQFTGPARYNLSTFESWADFSDSTFETQASFRGAKLERGLYGVRMRFCDAADFMSTVFVQVANFYNSTFESGGLFSSTKFEGDAKFIKCEFSGPTLVGEGYADDPSLESTSLDYLDGSIPGVALVIANGVCRKRLELENVSVDDGIHVTNTEIDGDISLKKITGINKEFVVNFNGVDFVSGSINVATGSKFDFSDSVIGDTEFTPSNSSPLDLTSIEFRGSVFDGFDFSRYKESFRSGDWQLHSDDMSPSDRENLYLRAKNGAIEIGESAAAREFHLREMKSRGDGYLRKAIGEHSSQSDETSHAVTGKIKYVQKYLANQFLRFSCGYGERPSRVILSSLVIICLYAGIYSALNISLIYQQPSAPLTLSFEAYNAILLGIPQVNSSLVGTIVATEAFLGPFFVALFVFTITQSLGR